jgi:hypothetical protein
MEQERLAGAMYFMVDARPRMLAECAFGSDVKMRSLNHQSPSPPVRHLPACRGRPVLDVPGGAAASQLLDLGPGVARREQCVLAMHPERSPLPAR